MVACGGCGLYSVGVISWLVLMFVRGAFGGPGGFGFLGVF